MCGTVKCNAKIRKRNDDDQQLTLKFPSNSS